MGPRLMLPVALGLLLAGAALAHGGDDRATRDAGKPPKSGAEIYRAACQSCHGADGRGQPSTTVGFATPLPDLTDCNFTTREANADWKAVVHEGGPARGFVRMMPAFGGALDQQEMGRVVAHVRTFCAERESWPRGELNLPRPLFTTKAFPEDEAVFSASAATEGSHEIEMKLVYEHRLGARGQVEVVVPFAFLELDDGEGDWTGGIGDLVLATKWALLHSVRTGSIFSTGLEVIMPTGAEDRGLGKGIWVLEPFLAFGQLLPLDSFLQIHTGMEVSTKPSTSPHEVFWRAALGMSFFEHGGFGRTWSPMLEVLGAMGLGSDEELTWDIVPQVQVTLSARHHVRACAGVRLPLSEFADRSKVVLMYLLWDWFDGGLGEGW